MDYASCNAQEPVALWIKETGIFASLELWYLYDALCTQVGLPKSEGGPEDNAVYSFSPQEEQALAAFLALGLYFFWDMYVFYFDGSIVKFSHDDYCELAPGNGQASVELKQLIESDMKS
jgi:hypothetical protein